MTAATDYLENEIVDHVLGTGSYTMPAQVYVKLHTGAPGESAASNAATNSTRKQADFSAASGGTAVNSADIAWTNVSTTETYTHFSVWDNLTAGNPLLYGAFSSSISVTAGDNFTIEAGDLSVTLA